VTWGLIDEKKLTRELIQGFARVAKHFPDSSLAILSGLHPHDNEYHRAVTEDITRLNLDTQVEWHHEVNDDALVHELTTAHVAVLLYKDGATWRRSTLIEAFTAGVPVITTKSHLTPPDLIDAHAATLIPPNPTPDTLAEAITTLFTDSAYAAANQRKGYTIAQRFSWKMIATETTRFYERILRNSGSRSQPDQ
jgi:glycosyltransferase involved in cell wall biosynthesis